MKKQKWGWLAAIIILWLIGGAGLTMNVYSSTTTNRGLETVKIAFLILGGLGVILPTYLNIWQSIENNLVLNEKIAWDKKENSFKLIEKWDMPQLVVARKFGRHLAQNGRAMNLTELMAKVNGDEDLHQSMIAVVNYWDEIRVSIIAERVDEKLIRYSLESSFIFTFKTFEAWLREHARINGVPNFYDDAHRLYIRWNADRITPANI